VSLYNPLIYVDRDSAMAGGREIGGWPKKIGDIRMQRFGNEYKLSFGRNGQNLVSAEMQIGSKLFSTPLPANTPVRLSYPYNMTFPLPAPTARPQATVPLPTTTLKMLPGVGSDSPQPALELGGKCPTIVHSSANLVVAAHRIAQGRWLNAGQTCTGVDHVLVFKDVKEQFLEQLKKTVVEFYGEEPMRSPDYGRMVSDHHHARISTMKPGRPCARISPRKQSLKF